MIFRVKHKLHIFLSLVVLMLCMPTYSYAGDSLASGKGNFTFSGWKGPKLKVWTYKPKGTTPDTPIVFVMHGTNRDGDRYRDEWVHLAKHYKFIVVCPEFPKSRFKGSRRYNLGNVFKKSGKLKSKKYWSFSAIEPLFDEVKQRAGSRQTGYSIYGHSAGSQFVHRFLYFVPEARVIKAIAANAGWYTMPNLNEEYPYGLKNTPVLENHLKNMFGKPLVVLLGMKDTSKKSKSLRKTPEAMQQGPHRLARGKNYFAKGKLAAESDKADFNWQLKFVPKVGHKNSQMAVYAAAIIAGEIK